VHGVGWFLETAYKDIILFCVAVWIQGMFVKNVKSGNVSSGSSVLLVVEILLPGNNTRVCLRHVPVLPVEECTPPGFLSILIYLFIIFIFVF